MRENDWRVMLGGSILTMKPKEPVLDHEPKNARGIEGSTAFQASAAWLLFVHPENPPAQYCSMRAKR